MIQYQPYEEKYFKKIQNLIWNSIRVLNSSDYDSDMIDIMVNWQDEKSLEEKFNKGTYYIALDENQVIGVGGLVGDEICTMFTDSSHLRLGIGSSILKLLEDEAKKKNIEKIFLSSTITAHEFYSKQGFTEIKKAIHKLNGHDFLVYVMEKNLS